MAVLRKKPIGGSSSIHKQQLNILSLAEGVRDDSGGKSKYKNERHFTLTYTLDGNAHPFFLGYTWVPTLRVANT